MAQRPPHVKPPAYLSKSPPHPEPAPQPESAVTSGEPGADAPADPLGLNPVRYGDWELKGIAVDF